MTSSVLFTANSAWVNQRQSPQGNEENPNHTGIRTQDHHNRAGIRSLLTLMMRAPLFMVTLLVLMMIVVMMMMRARCHPHTQRNIAIVTVVPPCATTPLVSLGGRLSSIIRALHRHLQSFWQLCQVSRKRRPTALRPPPLPHLPGPPAPQQHHAAQHPPPLPNRRERISHRNLRSVVTHHQRTGRRLNRAHHRVGSPRNASATHRCQ